MNGTIGLGYLKLKVVEYRYVIRADLNLASGVETSTLASHKSQGQVVLSETLREIAI